MDASLLAQMPVGKSKKVHTVHAVHASGQERASHLQCIESRQACYANASRGNLGRAGWNQHTMVTMAVILQPSLETGLIWGSKESFCLQPFSCSDDIGSSSHTTTA